MTFIKGSIPWNKSKYGYKTKPASKERKEKARLFNIGKHNFKHTPEALKKISEASKKLWKQKWYRDKMMKVFNRPNFGQWKKGTIPWNKWKKLSEGRKGKEFYKGTRRRIKKEKCKWCGSKENLEYDHIVPIGKTGTNDDKNCQVLCKKCNLLKRNIMDYPELYYSFNAKRANSAKT